ncbi:hypothetical protein BDW71DRAFT_179898 [Aspergillus fruticulosus]
MYPISLGKGQDQPSQRVFWSVLRLFWTIAELKRGRRPPWTPKGRETRSNHMLLNIAAHDLWNRAR